MYFWRGWAATHAARHYPARGQRSAWRGYSGGGSGGTARRPWQILWINLVTTVTLALAFEPTEADAMQRPPQPPREPLVTGELPGRVLYVSLPMMGAILAILAILEWQLSRDGDHDHGN
jgi:magnesium-transporting ATPase (P-type)